MASWRQPIVPDRLWKAYESASHVPTRLRVIWTLHAIGALTEKQRLEQLASTSDFVSNPYLRAWAIQLELEDRTVSPADAGTTR